MLRVEEVCGATDKLRRDQIARMLREAGAGYDNRADELVSRLRQKGWVAKTQGHFNVEFDDVIGSPYEFWELMMEAFKPWKWTTVSPPSPPA